MIFEDINTAIKDALDNAGLCLQLIDSPLDTYYDPTTKANAVKYMGDGEYALYVPDDRYNLQIAHLHLEGTNDLSKSAFDSWTHAAEVIVIGNRDFLPILLNAISEAGATPIRYDLNSQVIWRRYFDYEQYPEKHAFTVRYTFAGTLSDFETYCKTIC